MLYENIYLPPEPTMDLNLALRETTLAIQRAELDEIPEERVDLLRQFLTHVQMLQAQAMPPAPEPGPMPGPMSGGMPPMPPEMMGAPMPMA
jgi:hypothetical protein